MMAVAGLFVWGLSRSVLPTLSISSSDGNIRDRVAVAEPVPARRRAIATVYVFLSVNCPISNRVLSTLDSLYEEFASLGIEFVGVAPAANATAEAVEVHQRTHDIRFPVLWDRQHRLCEQLGATHTPQAVVVSADDAVLYSGRIDDRYSDLGRPESVVQQ